jgi:anti-sigma B factor antagonist
METGYFEEHKSEVNEVVIKELYLNNDKRFVVLDISGLLDTYNSSDFFRIIHRFLELEKRLVLVLDISKVNYMSSTGIGSCVEINKHCLKDNIKLYIKGMQKNVEEVFQLLGFYGFFNYIDELNDIKEEKIKRSLFPANIQCPYCSKKLKAQKTGSFKCPECLSAFRIVEANQEIKTEKRE